MSAVVQTPASYLVTCDLCPANTTSPDQVPEGWMQMPRPRFAGQTPPAHPVSPIAVLCPEHVAKLQAFWTTVA